MAEGSKLKWWLQHLEQEDKLKGLMQEAKKEHPSLGLDDPPAKALTEEQRTRISKAVVDECTRRETGFIPERLHGVLQALREEIATLRNEVHALLQQPQVSKLDVQPGDVLIVGMPDGMDAEAEERLLEELRTTFPGVKARVLLADKQVGFVVLRPQPM